MRPAGPCEPYAAVPSPRRRHHHRFSRFIPPLATALALAVFPFIAVSAQPEDSSLTPTNFGTDGGQNEINLRWDPPKTASARAAVTGYEIEISRPEQGNGYRFGGFHSFASVGAGTTTYTHKGLGSGQPRLYRLRATSATAVSPWVHQSGTTDLDGGGSSSGGSSTGGSSTGGSSTGGSVGGGSSGGSGGGTPAPPAFPQNTPAAFALAENHEPEATVGAVAATDANGDELKYALTGENGDHEVFVIDDDGTIRVAEGVTLDYEDRTEYVFTVEVSDGKDAQGNEEENPAADDALEVTVSVENVEEPPGAPTGLTVRAAGPDRLRIGWTAPAESGAPPVSKYEVRYFAGAADPADEADWIAPGETEAGETDSDDGPATVFLLGGLEPNTVYRVQVRAVGEGAGPWSVSAAGRTASLDAAASREHLFPLLADGAGFRVRLFLTNASGADNRCTLGLQGPGLAKASLFEAHPALTANASGAEIALGATGTGIALASAGAGDLAFGYATLSCAEPAVARLLLTLESGGVPVALANQESARSAHLHRLPLLPRLGRMGLLLANENEREAACAIEITTAEGASAGGGGITAPAQGVGFRFLDELVSLDAEETAGGRVAVSCDRPVAALGVPLTQGGVFTALTGAVPAETAETEETGPHRQVLPLLLDGAGFRSRLEVTNRSAQANACAIRFHGAQNSARFPNQANVEKDGFRRAAFTLPADGGRVAMTSFGRHFYAYGYAVLECEGPAAASNLLSTEMPETGTAGMAPIPAVQSAREFGFPLAPGVGRMALFLTNAAEVETSCVATLTAAGRDETLVAEPIRPKGESTALAYLKDLFALPEDFAGGALALRCESEVAAVALPFAGAAFAAMPPFVPGFHEKPAPEEEDAP